MTHTEISVHLPEEPNRFIGREQELGDLRHVLDDARALTLCGAGGIGKTRLALQVLATVAADFPDGVWLVELDDLREPRLVVSRVASAVGVPGEPGRPLIDTLADALAPRRMLLALDNCEHLIEACARPRQRLPGRAPPPPRLEGDEPGAAPDAGRGGQAGPPAVRAPGDAGCAAGGPAPIRRGQALRGPGRGGAPRFHPHRAQRRGRDRHLPGPGWRSAGHRTGRGARRRALPGADRRAPRRPLRRAWLG